MPLSAPMFTFDLKKSSDSSDDQFLSALSCARDSIESVLDNDALSITVEGHTVVIQSQDPEQPIGMTLANCRDKIKGCFCDSSGNLYPEFTKVVPADKST